MKPHDIFISHPAIPVIQAQPKDDKALHILSQVHKPLLTVTSFFPFDLFPDKLTINALEVIYTNNIFFWSDYQTSMLVEEIGDIYLVEGPFFASVTIIPIMNIKNPPIKIGILTRKKAQNAYHLIQGLITLKKEKVDLETLCADKKGVEEIIEIGKTNS